MSETYIEGLFGGKPSRELVAGLGVVLEAVDGRGCALAGALAVRAYVRLRPTFDADFLVDRADLKALVKHLEARGFTTEATPGEIGDITTLRHGRFAVDLIVPKVRLAREALKKAELHDVGDRKVRVVSREYLAAIKFFVGLRLGGREGAKHLQDARSLIESGADKKRVEALVTTEDPTLRIC